ncbi:hypothetical protein FA13DRAFT_1133255 [Coprinellus micaceus]|nr:hypothetical protein FA13DRAFT_1133255 [Coprinellus micaceus]
MKQRGGSSAQRQTPTSLKSTTPGKSGRVRGIPAREESQEGETSRREMIRGTSGRGREAGDACKSSSQFGVLRSDECEGRSSAQGDGSVDEDLRTEWRVRYGSKRMRGGIMKKVNGEGDIPM